MIQLISVLNPYQHILLDLKSCLHDGKLKKITLSIANIITKLSKVKQLKQWKRLVL